MRRQRYRSDPVLRDFLTVDLVGARALVRRGYEPHLELICAPMASGWAGDAVTGGRAAHPLVELPNGERVVVRGYRRGGVIRHVNRDRYFRGNRAMEELRATEHAGAAGVRVPEVVAAVERRLGFGYTALLATRWIEGGQELASWLGGRDAATVALVLHEAGRQIGRMHAAGIAHPDLNLRNLLVSRSGAEPEVHLLDFDRAHLIEGPVPNARRVRNLLRLARSARKLGAPIDAAGWAAFRKGYGSAWPMDESLG